MILPATAAHATALASIHAHCFAGQDAWSAKALAALVCSPGVSGLIDDRGGFVLWRLAVDEADIVTLAVMPETRRQGLGTALLASALDTLRDQAVTRIFLEVAETNEAAIALYRKFGFVTAGRRPAYYANGAAALLLRLALPPPA